MGCSTAARRGVLTRSARMREHAEVSPRPEDPEPPHSRAPRAVLSAERLKAFVDAVVAIAMTLLILPLLENVSEFAREGKSPLDYVQQEYSQLFSFALSFLIIAIFWTNHHRVFDRVEHAVNPLVWLQLAWMFTIVWLPVATAMLGSMNTDTTQKVLYIGALLASSLLMLATRLYLRVHPELHTIDAVSMRRGTAAEIILSALFALALLVAVLVPAIGYASLLLLMLSGPLQAFAARPRRAG